MALFLIPIWIIQAFSLFLLEKKLRTLYFDKLLFSAAHKKLAQTAETCYSFIRHRNNLIKEDKSMLDYEQVKNRVNRETEILPKLFIQTGIGMVAAILIAIFLFR